MDSSIRVPQNLLQKAKALLLKIKIVVSRKFFTLNEVVPTGDFQGYLEYPIINEESAYGTIIVAGWLISKTSHIEALTLSRDYLLEEKIVYGLERPDISQAFIDISGAGSSGFRWHIALEPNYSGNVDIQIWAILKNGERVCCFTRRFKVHASILHKRRMSNLFLFFRVAIVKALVAFKQVRLPLSPLLWIRCLRYYYQQIQADQSVAIYSNPIHPWQMQDPYQRWIETNHLTPKLLSLMTEDAKRLKTKGVKISIVVPIYNPCKQLLREMITSVTSQIYPNWELCLADDASSKAYVKEVLEQAVAEDARIKLIFGRTTTVEAGKSQPHSLGSD